MSDLVKKPAMQTLYSKTNLGFRMYYSIAQKTLCYVGEAITTETDQETAELSDFIDEMFWDPEIVILNFHSEK